MNSSLARCLVSFGANIGDAADTIRKAANELRDRTCAGQGESFRLSRLFKTPPVGGPTGQPPFINAVAALETASSPWHVWEAVRQVETLFGRERNQRWEARKLDLDILLYEQIRIWTPQLKIPHPRMCMRRFILAPANDVAPFWIDPVSRRSVSELHSALQQGASNLVLVASERTSASSILAQAAHQAGAEWREPLRFDPSKDEFYGVEQQRDEPSFSRWVKLVTIPSELSIQQALPNLEVEIAQAEPNLAIFLTPCRSDAGAAWEDVHRDLAAELRLADDDDSPAKSNRSSGILGPRYLLPSEDVDWAAHEIVAALDAMDCPVEPVG